MIELYAKREKSKGYAFPADTPWQTQFEDSFPYQETDDQLRCIDEVKKDMENSKPMDRLLCGDVGYGKTEVAIRAAFKAVMGGKQVAYLAPELFGSIAKEYEKIHPNVKINIINNPWDGFWTKLPLALQKGANVLLQVLRQVLSKVK